jgi:hypothetical protein
LKINLLQRSLPITENPGLSSTDPRFDEIATLVQQGNYTEAAKLSEIILADGIYDIRLICYFLFGYWLEHGLASLITVIDCLDYVILENWEAIGPVAQREKIVQNSLGWLFRQLLKKIQYEEKKNTQLWQQWKDSISADEVDNILKSSEAFRLSINHHLQDNAESVVVCSKIEMWLRALQRLVYKPPEVQVVEPEKIEVDIIEKISPAAPVTGALKIEVSHHMELLLKKLAAFEYLLQEQNFPRAALVADDINQTLESFDPRVYFPKTFGNFVKLQVLNFEELSVYEEHRGSQQWQAMQDWLKIDVDSFTKD